MSSYSYFVNKFNAQLAGVNTGSYKFNENGEIVKSNNSNKNVLPQIILSNMLSTLKQAPVFYITQDLSERFLENVAVYATTASQREYHNTQRVAKKIDELVRVKFSHGADTEEISKVNKIFDKSIDKIQPEELIELGNFAKKLERSRESNEYLFYRISAFIEKMKDLRHECPNLIIHHRITRVKDSSLNGWDYSILYSIPEDPMDLQFLLYLKFHYDNGSNLICTDPDFLKKLIQMKARTSDIDFKNYLKARLYLSVISSLCEQWDQKLNIAPKQADERNDNESNACMTGTDRVEPKKDLNDGVNIFESDKEKFQEKEVRKNFENSKERHQAYDQWHRVISEKLKEYGNLHSDAIVPRLMDHQEFVRKKEFFSKDDIEIPLLSQIRMWEKEIPKSKKMTFQSFDFNGLTNASESARNENNNFSERFVEFQTWHPDALLSNIAPFNISLSSLMPITNENSNLPLQLVTLPGMKNEDEKKFEISTQAGPEQPEINTEKQSQDLSSESKTEVGAVFSADSIENLSQPEIKLVNSETLHQHYQDTSPFHVKDRITQWFDPQKELNVLNDESYLVHNFAWAANDILWEFGLRYPRENDKGQHEPAIAMLCQVEHSKYDKPQLFRITATFDHVLNGSESLKKQNSALSYDSSWPCYHRALTRKDQNNTDIEDYIQIGKYQFVDFPALPSQRPEIKFPAELLNKKYPDGSYIESARESVITIRDPKHDSGKKQCRFHLFIVK